MGIYIVNQPTNITGVTLQTPSGSANTFTLEYNTCYDNVEIAFTTQDMVINETQTISVADPQVGATYTWEISGGGSLSTQSGSATTYTAPSTNPNCNNNATVSLLGGGTVLDTLQIATRASSFNSNLAAYYLTWAGGPGEDPPGWHPAMRECEYRILLIPIRCDGSSPNNWESPTCGYDFANPYIGSCPHCSIGIYYGNKPGCTPCWGLSCHDRVTDMAHAQTMCSTAGSKNTSSPSYTGIPCTCVAGSVHDVRTAQQKSDGCCPAALL